MIDATPKSQGDFLEELQRALAPRRRGGQLAPTRRDVLEEAIERFNERFAVVLIGSDVRIFQLGDPQIGKKHEHIQPRAFHHVYSIVKYVDSDGEQRPFSKYWDAARNRQTYLAVEFNPDPKLPPDPFTLNLWTGFTVKPVPGDWSLLRHHLFKVVCRSNPYWFAWVMNWLAQIIQEPHKKMGTAVAVRGAKGTGKSIFAQYFAKLMANNSLSISRSGQLLGRFNDHLVAMLFVLVEEAVWAGNKEGEGVLKDMITSETQTVEGKGKSIIQVRDFSRLWYCANAEWVVPATEGERRFCVLEASDEHKEDKPYFDAIVHQMENGGLEAMMFDLTYMWRTSWVNLRQPPKTKFLAQQVEQGMSPEERWWKSVLADGVIDADGVKHFWPDEETPNTTEANGANAFAGHVRSACPPGKPFGLRVSTDDVFKAYQLWARANNVKRPVSKEEIGRFVSEKAGAVKSRIRASGGGRPYVYDFDKLSNVRWTFYEVYGVILDDDADEPLAKSRDENAPADEEDLLPWQEYGEGKRGILLTTEGDALLERSVEGERQEAERRAQPRQPRAPGKRAERV